MKLRQKLVLISILLVPLLAGFLFALNAPHAQAVSAGDWKPGRIIDDVVFFNKDSMNVAQIQAFLNAKVPTCDRWRSSSNPNYQPPYTCLKEYQENTSTGESNYGRFNPDGSPYQVPGGKSAAQIIWEEAQNYNINPQSLLVMLQKEQSLITDDWPWLIQYQKAMGQSCPDTAPCDPAFAGFYNQVSGAAWQLRHYINHPDWFNYRAGVSRFVLFNPNSGCGGTNVFIENNATAALYNYTPYQPNAAALNNMYGTGDGCSSYGNRNFWRLFNDWFGSSAAPSFDWSLSSQHLYTDSTKTVGSSGSLLPDGKIYAVIKVKNNGNQTWTKNSTNTVRLGTIRPIERVSPFCDASWLSCSRPSAMQENTVGPGEIATFEFWIKAPMQGGQFNEYFGLVVEGVQWLRDIGLFYQINAQPPILSWQMTSQYVFTDETKTVGRDMANLKSGDKIYVGFTAKNTGNVTWTNSSQTPIRVGTISPVERNSAFAPGSSWLGSSRPSQLKEASVPPGGTGTFEFWMTVPNSPGTYNERFGLVAEGRGWLNDIGLSYYARVLPDVFSWQLTGQYVFTDETKTVGRDMANLKSGDKIYASFTAKNTGNVTWTNSGLNPVRVGTISPVERNSIFAPGSGWLGSSRPSQLKEASVPPGGTGTFEFWMTVPNSPGVYHERFGLVAEGRGWLNDVGLSYYAKIIQ